MRISDKNILRLKKQLLLVVPWPTVMHFIGQMRRLIKKKMFFLQQL